MGKLQQAHYTTDLLSPGHILPSQFTVKHREREPERRLWLATVEDAVRIIQTHTGSDLEEVDARQREIEWVQSDEVAVGSFCWICEVLGMEPDYIRKLALKGVA